MEVKKLKEANLFAEQASSKKESQKNQKFGVKKIYNPAENPEIQTFSQNPRGEMQVMVERLVFVKINEEKRKH